MMRDKTGSPEDEFLHFCYPHPLYAEYSREDFPVGVACAGSIKTRISHSPPTSHQLHVRERGARGGGEHKPPVVKSWQVPHTLSW